ncbi:MAG TPA: fibrobacter succinogenes major paralogous domain-containing protein, partial [Bacteroidales bacterium]|nr:fibrobacter succinogenes major paralogous domain-containing protein [Bacteroidales bacterium]
GYSWYRNNPANKKFGGLYNWFTVAAGNLCPQGWHVPTQMEYRTMEQSVGVPADSTVEWGWRGIGAGTHLKSTEGWNSGNGDNQSGFSAIPSGYRAWVSGQYRALGLITYFWTSTDDAINHKPTVAWYRRLDGTDSRIYNATTEKQGGKSVRCMKNP